MSSEEFRRALEWLAKTIRDGDEQSLRQVYRELLEKLSTAPGASEADRAEAMKELSDLADRPVTNLETFRSIAEKMRKQGNDISDWLSQPTGKPN